MGLGYGHVRRRGDGEDIYGFFEEGRQGNWWQGDMIFGGVVHGSVCSYRGLFHWSVAVHDALVRRGGDGLVGFSGSVTDHYVVCEWGL